MESRQHDVPSGKVWLPKFLRRDKPPDGGDTPPNERSPLLPKPDDEEQGDVYDLDDGEKSKWQLILLEFLILLRGSVPVILAYTLQNSLQTISVLIVGRLSPEALATAAFAYMFAMATGWLIALGGTTAIDTLASATFTGSKNKTDLGIILQRSFIILFLFYVPVAIMWLFAEPIFNALGQEPYLARDAARFLWVLIPGGIGYIYFEAMKKYLQAQGKQTLSVKWAFVHSSPKLGRSSREPLRAFPISESIWTVKTSEVSWSATFIAVRKAYFTLRGRAASQSSTPIGLIESI